MNNMGQYLLIHRTKNNETILDVSDYGCCAKIIDYVITSSVHKKYLEKESNLERNLFKKLDNLKRLKYLINRYDLIKILWHLEKYLKSLDKNDESFEAFSNTIISLKKEINLNRFSTKYYLYESI